MSSSTPALEAAILRRVESRADSWFPDLAIRSSPSLTLLSSRPRALLFAVRLDPAAAHPQVLAKVRREPTGARRTAATASRPRLAPTGSELGTTEATALEYAGLQEIHAIFGHGDGPLTAVRPLDLLVAENTVLMDYVDATTLRQLLVRRGRLGWARSGGRGPGDRDAWQAAGRWLRVFQERMDPGTRLTRQPTRAAVVELFGVFGEFLSHRLGRRVVGETAHRAMELASEVLPEQLQLAVNHGDYAPRNVFRRPDGRVAVFDPLPRWLAPRYEDLARMLVAIRLSGEQVQSYGTALAAREITAHEQAVIEGYRGEGALSLRELRCYQLLITFDRWAALLGPPPRTWREGVRSMPMELVSGYIHQEAERLLRLAHAEHDSTAAR